MYVDKSMYVDRSNDLSFPPVIPSAPVSVLDAQKDIKAEYHSSPSASTPLNGVNLVQLLNSAEQGEIEKTYTEVEKQALPANNIMPVGAVKSSFDIKSDCCIHHFLALHIPRILKAMESGTKDSLHFNWLTNVFTWYSQNDDGAVPERLKNKLIPAFMEIYTSNEGKPISNAKYIEAIYQWYCDIAPEDRIPPKTDARQYIENKGHDLALMILKSNPLLPNKKEIRMLDMGGGDGILTSAIAVYLNNMSTKRVHAAVLELDVDPEDKWNNQSKGIDHFTCGNNPPVTFFSYGGQDINTAKYVQNKRNDCSPSDESNPLTSKGKYDIILLQYTLHHLQNEAHQKEALRQLSGILNEDGIVIFSEHSSSMSEDELDLMHANTQIFSKLKEAFKAGKKKDDALLQSLKDAHKRYIHEETPAAYFSVKRLMDNMAEYGYEPMEITGLNEKPEKTYSIAFMKEGAVKPDDNYGIRGEFYQKQLKNKFPPLQSGPFPKGRHWQSEPDLFRYKV